MGDGPAAGRHAARPRPSGSGENLATQGQGDHAPYGAGGGAGALPARRGVLRARTRDDSGADRDRAWGFAQDLGRGWDPSPRGRGRRLVGGVRGASRGTIPAWAGSREHGVGATPGEGSIPAWAGEPAPALPARRRPKVHPRVGGGAISTGSGGRSSPVHPRVGGGAGCTSPGPMNTTGPSPRGRGAVLHHLEVDGDCGPSPRGRGRHEAERGHPVEEGSIPAWAGEPRTGLRVRCPNRVHPRVGGRAIEGMPARAARAGPSPRGRGTRGAQVDARAACGSIPAWAGEPEPEPSSVGTRRVHPRVGGEPWAGCPYRTDFRVHPAWAGEPPTSPCLSAGARGHPAWAGEA